MNQSLTGSGSQTAMYEYNLTAWVMLALAVAVVIVAPTQGLAPVGDTSPGRMLATGALALLNIAVVIAVMVRKRRDGDEYLNRVRGTATTIGTFGCIAIFSSWSILTPQILPSPTADHVIALLLVTTSLSWFYAQWRYQR